MYVKDRPYICIYIMQQTILLAFRIKKKMFILIYSQNNIDTRKSKKKYLILKKK